MDKIGRILIVNGQSLYKNNATGITMRSIFSVLPENKLMEVCTDKMQYPEKGSLKISSIQIPHKSMPLNYYIRAFMKLDNEYIIKDEVSKNIDQDVNNCTPGMFRSFVKAISETSPIFIDKKFIKKVDEFRPEYIYTMGSSFYVHHWVEFFAKRYKIPVVIHYMDNWRETMFANNRKKSIINKYLNHQVRLLEKYMKYGLTISQAMADMYKIKYGHNYLPIMNTVDETNIEYNNHDILNIIYAGGLHVGREETLHKLICLSSEINNIKYIVYTSPKCQMAYKIKYPNDKIDFRDFLPHDRVNEIYSNADVLLHIESFEKNMIEFTRFSLSTKIPEYMASGRPILCVAPDEIESFNYINRNKCGICVSDLNKFTDAVEELSDYKMRKTLGENGKKCAQKNHSIESLRKKLDTVFSNYQLEC